MSIYRFDNPEGLLTIGPLLLNTNWVTTFNNLDFLPGQMDDRGDTRQIPDVAEEIGYAFLTKATAKTVQLGLSGRYLHDGTEIVPTEAAQWDCCITNWLYLCAQLVGPYDLDATTANKVLHYAGTGGHNLYTACQVRGVKRGVSARDGDGYLILLATMRVLMLKDTFVA